MELQKIQKRKTKVCLICRIRFLDTSVFFLFFCFFFVVVFFSHSIFVVNIYFVVKSHPSLLKYTCTHKGHQNTETECCYDIKNESILCPILASVADFGSCFAIYWSFIFFFTFRSSSNCSTRVSFSLPVCKG